MGNIIKNKKFENDISGNKSIILSQSNTIGELKDKIKIKNNRIEELEQMIKTDHNYLARIKAENILKKTRTDMKEELNKMQKNTNKTIRFIERNILGLPNKKIYKII